MSIAKESDIKKKIYKVLEEELNKASINFDELWNNRKGLPCFIKILKSQYNNFLITASYYDSIKSENKERKSFLSPLMERRIKYDYLPLEGKSSWSDYTQTARFHIFDPSAPNLWAGRID